MDSKNIVLNVNGIEVIYNHVILVLKGVSLQVPEGGIVAILGGNGAGKTTTLRAISNLLKGERGEVTKGSIELRGERIENLSPADLVKRGVVQVMEGRHCFAHLTIEENLLTGSYTRTEQGRDRRQPGKGLQLLPAPENAPHLAGGLHLGRRAADVRHWPRAHDQPQHGAAGRALHGPGAADRGRGVQHRQDLNTKEKVTFLLAEQNTNMALKYADYGYIMESGPRRDGRRRPATWPATRT
jgi:branched-chain amino acid transport system ATP-binding protein